jgi:hypothetical protein
MEQEKDFMSNLGIMIPQGAFTMPKVKPIPKWKKAVCFMIGHRWGFAGLTYRGPRFPMKCDRCKETRWFDKYPLRMSIIKWADKTLDKIWPLCKIGIHRYKSHYGMTSYAFGAFGQRTETVRQQVYKCSCCKKIKTVNL